MKKRPLLKFAALLAALFFCVGDKAFCGRPDRAVSNLIRVSVLDDAPRLSISINGPYKIVALQTGGLIKEARRMWCPVAVKPVESGLVFGGEALKIYGIKIIADENTAIRINNRSFRGTVDIIRTEKLKLMVINHLDVEDYVSGVLYHEVSHKWPMEAIKAQAVVSRTFALYQVLERKGKDYDLRGDVYSQVYGGKTAERRRTIQAVDLTEGEVLNYNGKIFPAYFHATCGGKTEDASNLWKINLAPLKGVDCNFCGNSPHYKWRSKIRLSELSKKLKDKGFGVGEIKSIIALEFNASGRASKVVIETDLGTVTIPAKDFRLMIGPNLIRSANFKVEIKGQQAIFTGTGWGHGVGMCQWGAYSMAKKGFKYKQILEHYYPGSKLSK